MWPWACPLQAGFPVGSHLGVLARWLGQAGRQAAGLPCCDHGSAEGFFSSSFCRRRCFLTSTHAPGITQVYLSAKCIVSLIQNSVGLLSVLCKLTVILCWLQLLCRWNFPSHEQCITKCTSFRTRFCNKLNSFSGCGSYMSQAYVLYLVAVAVLNTNNLSSVK